MSEWMDDSLGNYVAIQTGPFGSLLHASDYVKNGIPSIMPVNIGAARNITHDKLAHISENDANRLEKYLVNTHDIVYSRRGDVEKCALITENENGWLCGTGCLRLRVLNKKLDPIFCSYYLSTDSVKSWVSANSVGTTMPNLNSSILNRLPILVPSLPEQKAIASVLSSLDDKIDLLHRQNKTLESMAETLFRQWFIEESQADWETTTLDCHITVAKGLSYKGSGLTTSDNGIPLFNLNSVLEGGGYKSTGIKYYNGDFKERHIIKSGDIIVANTEQGHEYRLIGYPAIIPTTKSELSIYTHHLFKININDDSYLTNAFMYYLLCSKDMHEQVVAATNGSTVNQLSADGLQRPEFKLPPEYKVKEFTTQIASFWKKISINNLQIKNIESLRDTLLPKLMSGEVRVQCAEEAIASVA